MTTDERYDLLSNRRRRFVLSYLLRHRSVPLRELSAELAAWENDVPVGAVTSKQRKRVYTALHQTHLIRLDKFGVVEYDRSRGTVTATPRIELFEPHLRRPGPTARHWSRLYGGVAVVGLLVSLGAMLGLPGVAGLPSGAIGVVLGGAVVTLALVQARTEAPSHPEDRGAERSDPAVVGLSTD